MIQYQNRNITTRDTARRQSRLQQTTVEYFFSEKIWLDVCLIRLDISCDSSVRQTIHMKHQALFSLKGQNELPAALLLVSLRVYCRKIARLFKGLLSHDKRIQHSVNST